MAAARDQAARVVRQQPEASARPEAATAEDEAARDPAQLADQLRTHVAEETRRQPATAPGAPATDRPAGPPADAAQPAAPKSGKRKFVMMGVFALLALAAVSYGVYYTFIGRFYISTDDAYVRANNTTLGARVAGHIASIIPQTIQSFAPAT